MAGSNKLNVAISGLNAADVPAPGIGIARCLKEAEGLNIKIIGLAYDAFEPGILDSNMIDCTYLMPYPKLGKTALLSRIIEINKKEKVDLVIPSLDSELLNFIRIKDELNNLGIKTFLPNEKQLSKTTKINLHKLCHDIGLQTLKTKIINSMHDVNAIDEKFPILVKGAIYEAYVAHDTNELIYYTSKIAHKWGFPVIVQEYVQGEEINATCIGNEHGNLVGFIGMKKVVTSQMGKGWTCISIKNEILLDISKKILGALKWKGPIEIEGIFSKTNNNYYILELNPRFPQWIYLSKGAGVNLPLMCLNLAMGNNTPMELDYKAGIVFTNYTTNVVTDISKLEPLFTKGELTYEKSI